MRKTLYNKIVLALFCLLLTISCTVDEPTKEADKIVIEYKDNPNIKLDQGLVVHYEFDSPTSILTDSSSRGNDGLAVNNTIYLPVVDGIKKKIGSGAARFDSSSMMLVDLSADVNFKASGNGDGLTFSLWVYKTVENTALYQFAVGTYAMALAPGESNFNLCVDGPGQHHKVPGYVFFSHQESSRYQTNSVGQKWDSHAHYSHHGTKIGAIPANSWNHVVVVKDKTEWVMYVNGDMVESPLNLTFDFYPVKFKLGQTQNDDGSFIGYIDDFRLYERALNIDEIKKLAAQ